MISWCDVVTWTSKDELFETSADDGPPAAVLKPVELGPLANDECREDQFLGLDVAVVVAYSAK